MLCYVPFCIYGEHTKYSFLNELTRAWETGLRMLWMACSAVEVVDRNIYSLRTKDSHNLIKPSHDGRCCRRIIAKRGKQSRGQMLWGHSRLSGWWRLGTCWVKHAETVISESEGCYLSWRGVWSNAIEGTKDSLRYFCSQSVAFLFTTVMEILLRHSTDVQHRCGFLRELQFTGYLIQIKEMSA